MQSFSLKGSFIQRKAFLLCVSCITVAQLLLVSLYLQCDFQSFTFRNLNLTSPVTNSSPSLFEIPKPLVQEVNLSKPGEQYTRVSSALSAGRDLTSLWVSSAAALFKFVSDSQATVFEQSTKRLALSEQLHRHYQNYTSSSTGGMSPTLGCFQFPLNPAKQSDCKAVDYLAVIASAPSHFEHRDVIRRTWARDWHRLLGNRMRIHFIVGQLHPNNQTVQQALQSEHERFGDLIQANFTDSYTNLTLKSVALLQWTKDYCPNVRVLHKCDDDVFVNVQLLYEIFRALPDKNAVYGNLIKLDKPHRNPSNKYYISEDLWPWSVFPPFVLGGSYLIGGRAIAKLYNVTRTMPLLPLEDVYITGLCPGPAGVRRIAASKVYNQGFPSTIDACYLQNYASWQTPSPEAIKYSSSRVHEINKNQEPCQEPSLMTKISFLLG